jgi:hypothetical protein
MVLKRVHLILETLPVFAFEQSEKHCITYGLFIWMVIVFSSLEDGTESCLYFVVIIERTTIVCICMEFIPRFTKIS